MHSDKIEHYNDGKLNTFNDSERNPDRTESYYIEGRELELLLAGASMKSWFGLSLRAEGEGDSLTQEDIHRILAGLYQKGYVSWDQKVIRLQKPVSDLVRILKDADSCIKIEWNREEEPLLLIYRDGDRSALLEESRTDSRSYRFRIWDRETLSRFLRDQAGHVAKKKKYNLKSMKKEESKP